MKFIVEYATKFSGRLGYLVNAELGQKLETPLLLQTTKGGSIPYLSREVFKHVTEEPQVLEICVASTDHMEDALKTYERGLSSFIGYPESMTFVTLKDPCETSPSGYHVKDAIPIFTRRGKRELTADSFMNIIEAFKPNIYHPLCDDDTEINSSKKRISKSVTRTEGFFEICLKRHKNSKNLQKSLFFGPIVGGYDKHARSQSIEFISEHPEVDGYIIKGLHTNGESAAKLNTEAFLDIVSYCMEKICREKPKMILGAFPPLTLLKLIQLGVDIFDSSYVYIASNANQGLIFDYDLNADKRSRKLSINLNDDSFAEDFSPIQDTCSCVCCRKHTRAYINHLIKTRELLAPILLMIHNMHHYLKFFESIRKCIREDKLQELLTLVGNCEGDLAKEETKNISVPKPKNMSVAELKKPISVAN